MREPRQRLDDHVRRLVVRRHVQAHERQLASRPRPRSRHRAGSRRRQCSLPSASHSSHRYAVPRNAAKTSSSHSSSPPISVRDRQPARERPVEHEREIGDEEKHGRRPAQMTARAPPPGDRQPDQARDDESNSGDHGVVPGRAKQLQYTRRRGRDDRGPHQCEDQPPGPRPRTGRSAGRGRQREEQDEGRQGGGDQPRHQQRSEHDSPVFDGQGSSPLRYPGVAIGNRPRSTRAPDAGG